MTQQPIDLKLFSEAKELLTKDNDKDVEDKFGKATPGAFKLFSFPMMPKNPCDEVYDCIFLGDNKCVKNEKELKKLRVTHILNASMGSKFNQTDTDSAFYEAMGITFHGIPALDVITFKMGPYLHPAAQFIDSALSKNGKVYVHCQQGISRSATVVIAFLMICRGMNLLEAVSLVRSTRRIFPNDGFLKQLCVLQKQLNDERENCLDK